jgi:Trypsin-co-occurring domain 2
MADEWTAASQVFLAEVKTALQEAESELQAEGLKITKLELALKTAVEKKVEGSIEFKIIELGADVTAASTQTFTIVLKPTPPSGADQADLARGLAEELAQGIAATVAVTREAATIRPPFGLDEATIEVDIGMTKEGKAKIFVGGSYSKETTHTATFTLAAA